MAFFSNLSLFILVFSFSVSFEFRTAESAQHQKADVLLWVWASYRNYTRYFMLHLDRGFLELDIKGNKGVPVHLLYKHRRLNDAQWHRVEFEKRNRLVQLKVGECIPNNLRRKLHCGMWVKLCGPLKIKY